MRSLVPRPGWEVISQPPPEEGHPLLHAQKTKVPLCRRGHLALGHLEPLAIILQAQDKVWVGGNQP